MTVFVRLVAEADKESALREAVNSYNHGRPDERLFVIDSSGFRRIPTSPFAYSLVEDVAGLFTSLRPTQGTQRIVAEGLNSTDNFRFLRLSWEVPILEKSLNGWVPLAKGGSFAQFYSDLELEIEWKSDGAQLKALVESRYGSASKRIYGEKHYFKSGITYSQRSQRGLSFRALPSGSIFNVKGPAIFSLLGDDLEHLAFFNSVPYRALVEIQTAFGSYNVGYVQRTPLPDLAISLARRLRFLALEAWRDAYHRQQGIETSHAFVTPWLCSLGQGPLSHRVDERMSEVRRLNELTSIRQQEIDDLACDAYGLRGDVRERLRQAAKGVRTDPLAVAVDRDGETADGLEPEAEDIDGEDEPPGETPLHLASLVSDLVMWSVGVAFGRFDLRLALNGHREPPEPGPFDVLPACSPGMLTGKDGKPMAQPPSGYPCRFPTDGLLVDDPGHDRDLTRALRTIFDIVFGEGADARWQEAGDILDSAGQDIRRWVAKNFFDFHIKRYSKSRRKAPIYWQLATPSASYSVWLYAHRLTGDSLYQVQNDLVAPKLSHEERKFAELVRTARPTPSADERAAIAAAEASIAELRTMHDEVKRVAALWRPNLNDGLILTMAPLWRLVPQDQLWQRELKAAWDALCAGKYDWAHLAMHLWPERVVPACAIDRSLAIAHGLENIFWVEGDGGKWTRRATPTRRVEELIRERTSSAVQAALKSLLEASAPSSSPRRRRGRAAESATARGAH
jgi:hypothetical protein